MDLALAPAPSPWLTTPIPPTTTSPQEGVQRGGGASSRKVIGQGGVYMQPKIMVYNNWYDKALWKGLDDQARPMHDIIKRTKALGLDLPLPPHNDQKEACPS